MESSPLPLNKPLYLYQCPMFMITVSTVIIIDHGVILVKNEDEFKFPGGRVKAGQETLQFAAIRYIKEQAGINIRKNSLMPVDFRSNPERTPEGNVVDIGFVCTAEHQELNGLWKSVDFEKKCLMENVKTYIDHDVLLERAVEIYCMSNY